MSRNLLVTSGLDSVRSVSVPAAETRDGITHFQIRYTHGGALRTISRRYSDFRQLRDALPFSPKAFPRKHVRNCSGKKLDDRRDALEKWLQSLVQWLQALGQGRERSIAIMVTSPLNIQYVAMFLETERYALQQEVAKLRADLSNSQATTASHATVLVTQLRGDLADARATIRHVRTLREASETEKDKMQQEITKLRTDLEDCKAAAVTKSTAAPGGLGFQYELREGEWASMMCDSTSELVEKYEDYRRDNSKHLLEIAGGGNLYEIDFTAMTQRNVCSNKARKIRYRFERPHYWTKMHDHPLWSNLSIDAQLMEQRIQLMDATADMRFSDFCTEITDQATLDAFTERLKSSIHHQGHSQPASNCEKLKEVLRVKKAWRIQNWPLWQAYATKKRELVEKHKLTPPEHVLSPIDDGLRAFGTDCKVQDEVNEVVLFHGTKRELADIIVEKGFDNRVAKPNGYYGRGTYFASQVCKSWQYTDSAERLIIVSRVLLGAPWAADKVDRSMTRPPAMLGSSRLHDSVVAKPGKMPGHHADYQTHQEFVIFEQAQAYPDLVLQMA